SAGRREISPQNTPRSPSFRPIGAVRFGLASIRTFALDFARFRDAAVLSIPREFIARATDGRHAPQDGNDCAHLRLVLRPGADWLRISRMDAHAPRIVSCAGRRGTADRRRVSPRLCENSQSQIDALAFGALRQTGDV